MTEIDQVRKDAEKLIREVDEEYYSNWAGLKEELNTSAIYDRYSHIFEKKVIDQITELREDSDKDTERRLKYLQLFVSGGYLEQAVKELTDMFETESSKEKITVDGEEMAFRFSAAIMKNEDDRERRIRIHRERNKVTDKLNVILMQRWEKLHTLAKDLGYRNYLHLYKDQKGIDFFALRDMIKEMLGRTESLYVSLMSEALEPIGISLEEAEKHDISYLFRAKMFDRYFKKENAVPTLRKTLLGMGIDLEAQKNIILDTEEREKKSPRAFCAPLEVPDRIMLVTMPKGGHDDYNSLFHECGHAEHFGNAARDMDMEYKYLGDNSVTESYAFLLEYLSTDRNWIEDFIGIGEMEQYLDFVFMYKLFFIRRYGAKLIYEIKLHEQGLTGMDSVYAETLGSALKFKHPPNQYLVDLDDGFYTAQYLQAWLFEAQLRSVLREKFGERWYAEKASGDFLKSLWSSGQKYNVVELAQSFGFQGLDIEPLIEEIEENFER